MCYTNNLAGPKTHNIIYVNKSKVQTLFVNKWNSSLRNPNFLQKQREPNTAIIIIIIIIIIVIIIINEGVLTLEDKEGCETGQEEDNKQKQCF